MSPDAGEIAAMLLEIGAVRLRPDDPFTLTSGKPSPVYVDCRRIISYPDVRRRILDRAFDLLRQSRPQAPDAVAGGETAGIPFAAWLGERWNLPMLYVRKQAKGFGSRSRIEGHLDPGADVLLVEDLASDGGSKLVFIDALRQAGYRVKDAFVVFCYGGKARRVLAERGVKLHALCDWQALLAKALATGRLDPGQREGIDRFLADYDE